VRLDHLLSKEHHEKSEASGLARAVKESVAVVAPAGCATTNRRFLFPVSGVGVTAFLPGTLLGPETTPAVVLEAC
jgi:hypothetical protein